MKSSRTPDGNNLMGKKGKISGQKSGGKKSGTKEPTSEQLEAIAAAYKRVGWGVAVAEFQMPDAARVGQIPQEVARKFVPFVSQARCGLCRMERLELAEPVNCKCPGKGTGTRTHVHESCLQRLLFDCAEDSFPVPGICAVCCCPVSCEMVTKLGRKEKDELCAAKRGTELASSLFSLANLLWRLYELACTLGGVSSIPRPALDFVDSCLETANDLLENEKDRLSRRRKESSVATGFFELRQYQANKPEVVRHVQFRHRTGAVSGDLHRQQKNLRLPNIFGFRITMPH